MTAPIKPTRALISVSDKTGIVEFADLLCRSGVQILSTGGTAKTLRESGIPVTDVSAYTGFPEMMDGRLKTLHPRVHGGILGLRDTHAAAAAEHGIGWIDLVVCNLYPFAQTIQKPDVAFEEAVENIDIGGPAMIRAAAKNMDWVAVVVDPADYTPVIEELRGGGISFAMRRKLSAKAFGHTAEYDALIHAYLAHVPPAEMAVADTPFPADLTLAFKKHSDLRYGENPHQRGSIYAEINPRECTILSARSIQGKHLSYNNMSDADAALATLKEFSDPACVVVKHANPCGVAAGTDIAGAYARAYNADQLSAFGGVIALNRPCTRAIAEHLAGIFAEVVLAPYYDADALALLAQKKNLRVLELGAILPHTSRLEYRSVEGGLLVQDADTRTLAESDLAVATAAAPTARNKEAMLFAWKVLKHIKSNAILLAKEDTTVGMGAGQVSRVDAVDLALTKAGGNTAGCILASDAFFPFRDSIDRIAGKGITAIIQPGGSIKDQEVIDACNEHGIAMVFTGTRCFKH